MTQTALTQGVIGVDIGTSSSKGVLVSLSGTVLATATRPHRVSRPTEGHVEMDASLWWEEFVSITRELLAASEVSVAAVGVSGMGPCVQVADAENTPLRPAILYGVDTRAVTQIKQLTDELGESAIVERCGSALSTQAVGPKLLWVAHNEPAIAARTRRLFMPSSFLVHKLTGQYVLDHHSASQCTPMYDTLAQQWHVPWVRRVAPELELPRLEWPGAVAGHVTLDAAEATGLERGTPVITGTIDAWAEAVSVGAHEVGDLMLMYGTTMFLINTLKRRTSSSSLWGTVGAFPDTFNLAGGMATSGAITSWLRELLGSPNFDELTREAAIAGPGANGLLMLPYFAGERTPFADPDARGTLIGLTLDHTRGDLYRAALEATAFGVRHNVAAVAEQGGEISRIVGVGGGTQGDVWTQIVSDVTGLTQTIPSVTIGASFGSAFLAANAVGTAYISDWNPPALTVHPRGANRDRYDSLFSLYLDLYSNTSDLTHALVALARS